MATEYYLREGPRDTETLVIVFDCADGHGFHGYGRPSSDFPALPVTGHDSHIPPSGMIPFLKLASSVLFLTDPSNGWYNDLPNEGFTHFIGLIKSALGVKQVFTTGYSMGGFAAILYGSKLRAAKILAFAPAGNEYFYRGIGHTNHIPTGLLYKLDPASIRHAHVYYGELDARDKIAAHRLKELFSSVSLHLVAKADHRVIRALTENGTISDVVSRHLGLASAYDHPKNGLIAFKPILPHLEHHAPARPLHTTTHAASRAKVFDEA